MTSSSVAGCCGHSSRGDCPAPPRYRIVVTPAGMGYETLASRLACGRHIGWAVGHLIYDPDRTLVAAVTRL